MSFVMVPTALLGADPYTQAVYMAIKSHFPKCFPSVQRIASLAGCSHVTVIRRIKKLQVMGLITVFKGKRGQSNKYDMADHTLTKGEKETKSRGFWKTVSWRKAFFGSKKAVNNGQSKTTKAVNQVKPNYIKKELDGERISSKDFFKRHPEFSLNFMRSM